MRQRDVVATLFALHLKRYPPARWCAHRCTCIIVPPTLCSFKQWLVDVAVESFEMKRGRFFTDLAARVKTSGEHSSKTITVKLLQGVEFIAHVNKYGPGPCQQVRTGALMGVSLC